MSQGMALYGMGLFGDPIEPPRRGKIADTFIVPPFSVLNAREGFWQERKAAWASMGIKSEIGRSGCGSKLAMSDTVKELKPYADQAFNSAKDRHLGRRPHAGSLSEVPGREPGAAYEGGDAWVASNNGSGTSIFDPVLTELCYRWFCPPVGLILDPFAGGSVRGIVASCLGRQYFGIELRSEQIESNRQQAAEICDNGPMPEWIEGDSRNTASLLAGRKVDFVFSCPPYGNLEVYSDDPADLSTLQYPQFIDALAAIVAASCSLLKQDRFACFVVGNFRDKHGNYHDFAGDTIRAFKAAGLDYYNEAILVTAVGSLPIRITKQFASGRKLGKTHQNVLTFIKGDAKRASGLCEKL